MKTRKSRINYFKIVTVTFSLFALMFVAKIMAEPEGLGQTLGVSTLLARGGDDNSGPGSESSGSSNSGSGSSNSGSSNNTVTNPPPPPAINNSGSGSQIPGSKPTTPEVRSGGRPEQENEREIENETESEPEPNHLIPIGVVPTNAVRQRGKLKIQVIDGQSKTRIEDKDGKEIEATETEMEELENDLDEDLKSLDLKLNKVEDRTELVRGGVRAKTTLPVSVDLQTHELEVTTANGPKIVTVLPDVAVRNMLNQKVLDDISKGSDRNNEVEIIDDEGEAQFVVKGTKSKKMFGFIPVNINKAVSVSAVTGEVVIEKLSFGDRLKNFLSF